MVNIPPDSNEAGAVYEQANTALDEQYNMTMLDPMAFNNTYTLAVKENLQKRMVLKRLEILKV